MDHRSRTAACTHTQEELLWAGAAQSRRPVRLQPADAQLEGVAHTRLDHVQRRRRRALLARRPDRVHQRGRPAEEQAEYRAAQPDTCRLAHLLRVHAGDRDALRRRLAPVRSLLRCIPHASLTTTTSSSSSSAYKHDLYVNLN